MVRKWRLGRSMRSVVACLALAVSVIPLVTASPVEGQVVPVIGPPYASSAFKFKTTVKDDKEGNAAGWQEASAVLLFTRSGSGLACLPSFTCKVTVGMPLRTTSGRYITAASAADTTSAIATLAATDVGVPDPIIQPVTYCENLGTQMKAYFKIPQNRDIGARVESK